VRIALGSVAPTVIRCREAEAAVASFVDHEAMTVSDDAVRRFGELVAAASRPIDDHRSTAAYRRHAVDIMAQRLLRRAFPGRPS
jgi:CO/xanthine dehydrogenase FAD-binding subunit